MQKDSILKPVVTTATSRLAHIRAALMSTMRVLVPGRENVRNFIDTPFLIVRQTKSTSTIVESQQRNIPRQNQYAAVTGTGPAAPP